MGKNRVQKRVRAKREQERAQRKRSQKMRKLRAWATVAAVAVLGAGLFLLFKGDGKTRPSASPSLSPSAPAGGVACNGAPRGKYAGKKYTAAPKMTINTAKTYTAVLKTSCGDITVALAAKTAPKTVNNFVFLAREKFYDNTIFHRVIPDFMAQGGDPLGTGTGDPGYKFADETKPTDKIDKAGILAMANSGPDTNGSQFFITHAPATHLNGKHTIFGTVAKGLDVLDKIVKQPRNTQDKPNLDVVLYSVTITEK